MSSTESREQEGFVRWFRQHYPDVVIFAIPNGGARHIHTATILKLEGVLPGVPDLYIPAWKLWIEMKRKRGGKLSSSQTAMISYLESVGYTCIVAMGAEDGSRKILSFLSQKPKQL